MDNQDNLFDKIKSAAENAETKPFPEMEKVWSRVDAKLDTKVEKKQNNNWKKLMIAASIIGLITIGYQFLKEDKQVVTPDNDVVNGVNKSKLITPKLQIDTNAVVVANPLIKEIKNDILSKQLNASTQVTLAKAKEGVLSDTLSLLSKGFNNTASSNPNSTWHGNGKFESRGVEHPEADKIAYQMTIKENKEDEKKLAPILVVDGKIVNKDISNLDENEIDSIIELPEPLYIINGVYYTEKELFGPEPTSPYAPLNKQKIETFTILEPEKAFSIYGEKGKKGIVIVTTKDGKPIPQKKK